MPNTLAWTRKKMPVSRLKVGVAIGFLLVAMVGAGASYADGIVGSDPEPLSTLVRFNDRDYEVSAADWVSLTPLSSVTVRKIGYGRAVDVSVATTATGVYSSDGMVSPHIRYPGIDVRPVPLRHIEASVIWHHVPGTRLYTMGRIPSSVRIIDLR